MTSNQMAGWIGGIRGIAGLILGGLGGLVGTHLSIRRSNRPRERAWEIRAALVCWLGLPLLLVGLWWIPAPYRFLLWLLVYLLLNWGIRTMHQQETEIRQREASGDV